MPYYLILIGFLGMSVGFNLVQNYEIKSLEKQKMMYKVLFEYLNLKLEAIEQSKKDFVYIDNTDLGGVTVSIG
jgi:hypothetical protein